MRTGKASNKENRSIDWLQFTLKNNIFAFKGAPFDSVYSF